MPRGQGGTLSGFTPLSTPNAPTGLSVSTSIGSATVSFEPPDDTGDGAITSFIVTAIDESTGDSAGATGSASPITISPGGGTFKIRAQAVNGFGAGRLTEFDTGNVIFSGAELYVWGSNGSGRLGLGDINDRSSPVQVGALTTWAQVSAGSGHTGAIKTDGTLWAWGYNAQGQAGQNSIVDSSLSSPVQIGALTNWSQLSSGGLHKSSIKTDGTLWAWGRNNSGQLGDNTTVNKSSPIQVGALTDWAQVSAGSQHTVAIRTGGELYAWGANGGSAYAPGYGRLGDGTTINRSSPVQVGALTTWSQASAGVFLTAALKTDGTLWTWGGNDNGQLGQNNVIFRSSPVQVGALTNWAQVSAGQFQTISIKTDGTLWAWGRNNSGELGDDTVYRRSSPVQVGALTNWAQVSSASGAHTAALKTDGTLWMWGSNGFGQLGDNATSARSSPIQIGALTDWAQVSAGAAFTAALQGVL
jgi:alpha-tubulin suppressor-like RCC1 family protein